MSLFNLSKSYPQEEAFLAEVRKSNALKAYRISLLGVFFSALMLSTTDYMRYHSGLLSEWGIYQFAFFSHLLLGTSIITVFFYYKNLRAVKKGTYRYIWHHNTFCMVIMGMSLIPMGIVGVYDRGSILPFAAFIIITNLFFVIKPNHRILINLFSFLIMIGGIVFVVPGTIDRWVHIIEALGISLPCYLISDTQYRLHYNAFVNKRILEKQNETIQMENTELMMKSLQAQMNPHFIFNTLNSIQHFLVTNDQESSLTYMNRFARLIRMIFQYSKEPSIKLEDEIEFLELYLQLEELRFENKIETKFVVDPALTEEANEIMVPPLLIQPLIENAFKHGLMHIEKGGRLNIHFLKKDSCFKCIIEDNGVGLEKASSYDHWRPDEAHESSALEIIAQRLEILNGSISDGPKRNSLKINDRINTEGESEGTQIELSICIKTQQNLYDKFKQLEKEKLVS